MTITTPKKRAEAASLRIEKQAARQTKNFQNPQKGAKIRDADNGSVKFQSFF
jgi:hypothetical protein